MEQKLWAVAFTRALLKTRLDLFCGKTDGDGTLGSQEGNPLNFTLSLVYHRTLSSHACLRKFFFLWHSKNFTSTDNKTIFLPLKSLSLLGFQDTNTYLAFFQLSWIPIMYVFPCSTSSPWPLNRELLQGLILLCLMFSFYTQFYDNLI